MRIAAVLLKEHHLLNWPACSLANVALPCWIVTAGLWRLHAKPVARCNWLYCIGEGEAGIAEIGNNHNGDIEIARKLIDAAHAAGADCAKFQMRDMSKLYSNAGDSNDMKSDLGTQYTSTCWNVFSSAMTSYFVVLTMQQAKDLCLSVPLGMKPAWKS